MVKLTPYPSLVACARHEQVHAVFNDHATFISGAGVGLSASDGPVRTGGRTVKQAAAAAHIRQLCSLGLPADFLEMATRKAAQLNDAYRKIKAVRKAEVASA